MPLLGHTNYVFSVCTDGQRIISGSNDGTICIWSCNTRQLIGEPIKVGKFVIAVALSNNGRIAVGVDQDVCVFDIETRQQIAQMKDHGSWVWTVAISPDGSRIASGIGDKTIRIWDVQTSKQTHKLDGHGGHVRCVAFSPDGHWIASGSNDKTVCVWNSQTGQIVGLPLKGHTHYIRGISFSPDSLQLISGGTDRTIHVWSARGEWQKASQQITAIHLSSSRQSASSPSDRISLEGHSSIISACCSSDGSLYAASTLEGHVSIWNMDHRLVWEANVSIHPIHLLRFSTYISW